MQQTLFPIPSTTPTHTTLPVLPPTQAAPRRNTINVAIYHGTFADYHGVFTVEAWDNNRATLRDFWGNTLRCRRTSISLIQLPTLTKAHKRAMIAIFGTRRSTGTTPAMWRALTRLGMAERTDDPTHQHGYRFTRVGLEVARYLNTNYWG